MNPARPLSLVSFLVLAALLSGLAAATGSGALAPPHSDAGVDTNGDRLFNSLRVDVNLQISAAGSFNVLVVLNDDFDLAELTRSISSVSLATGARTASVLLDGPDLYNGGVDGPWYAHITLRDELGATLSTGTHVTAAYRFADFQPYAARIVPPASERTLDNDTDGLSDWIDVGITVDVATAATYTLASHLTDTTYTVAEEWSQALPLGTGRTTLHQLFPGYPIRLAARDGPYLVTNSLYRADGTLIDFLYLETQAYAYTSFEQAPARLAPPHADSGEDPDGDGLFSTLRLDVRLTVDVGGTYTVRGQLRSAEGTPIQDTVARVTLLIGSATVALRFAGSSIFASGLDGPYAIDLTVFDEDLRTLSTGSHWTAAYTHSDFEPRILTLAPPYEDLGIDVDADGAYDALRMLVRANVSIGATVRFDVVLKEGVGAAELIRVSRTTAVSPGLQTVAVDLPGADLIATGLDGPYRLWIEVYDAEGSLLDADNHRTQPYLLDEFEAGPRARIVGLVAQVPEDPDGDGVFNRLRLRVGLDLDAAGWYRLSGSLLSGGIAVADDEAAALLGAGPSSMDLVFAGPAIRGAGLDGPFDLPATLAPAEDGGVAYDSSALRTDVFQASSFEAAASIAISGRVVSDFRVTPLAGATVWLLDYTNHVSRSTSTDASGAYALVAPAGSYWVLVDHPDGQAQVRSETFDATAIMDVTLAAPRRDVVQADFTWMGWDRLHIGIRYVFHRDGPAVRFALDWASGDRDGLVSAAEASLLPLAADAMRQVVDAGDSADRLMVNGGTYRSLDPASWTDGVAGGVGAPGVPTLTISRSFVPEAPLGSPGRVQLVTWASFDTLSVDHRTRLYLPGAYRYVSADSTSEILVAARKIPYLVDPGLPPAGSSPGELAWADFLLFFQTAYAPPIPAAPNGLVASVTGAAVSLDWSRPTSNLDGSRIANLAGYQVYRRASPLAAPGRVNAQLVTVESFRDYPGGGTFLYSVAAVNTDGVEGPRSPEVQVTITSVTLTVSVVGPDGAGIAGATVSLEDTTGRTIATAVTNEEGIAFLTASIGAYTLRISGPTIVEGNIPLDLGADASSLTVEVARPDASAAGSGVIPVLGFLAFAAIVLLAAVSIRRRFRDPSDR
jgi:hypothetical protein